MIYIIVFILLVLLFFGLTKYEEQSDCIGDWIDEKVCLSDGSGGVWSFPFIVSSQGTDRSTCGQVAQSIQPGECVSSVYSKPDKNGTQQWYCDTNIPCNTNRPDEYNKNIPSGEFIPHACDEEGDPSCGPAKRDCEGYFINHTEVDPIDDSFHNEVCTLPVQDPNNPSYKKKRFLITLSELGDGRKCIDVASDQADANGYTIEKGTSPILAISNEECTNLPTVNAVCHVVGISNETIDEVNPDDCQKGYKAVSSETIIVDGIGYEDSHFTCTTSVTNPYKNLREGFNVDFRCGDKKLDVSSCPSDFYLSSQCTSQYSYMYPGDNCPAGSLWTNGFLLTDEDSQEYKDFKDKCIKMLKDIYADQLAPLYIDGVGYCNTHDGSCSHPECNIFNKIFTTWLNLSDLYRIDHNEGGWGCYEVHFQGEETPYIPPDGFIVFEPKTKLRPLAYCTYEGEEDGDYPHIDKNWVPNIYLKNVTTKENINQHKECQAGYEYYWYPGITSPMECTAKSNWIDPCGKLAQQIYDTSGTEKPFECQCETCDPLCSSSSTNGIAFSGLCCDDIYTPTYEQFGPSAESIFGDISNVQYYLIYELASKSGGLPIRFFIIKNKDDTIQAFDSNGLSIDQLRHKTDVVISDDADHLTSRVIQLTNEVQFDLTKTNSILFNSRNPWNGWTIQ